MMHKGTRIPYLLRMPPHLHHDLKHESERQGIPMNDILQHALLNYLDLPIDED